MKRRFVYAALAALILALAPLAFTETLAKRGAKKLAAARNEAVTLYTQARYAEARPLLEQLDSDGGLTGTLLYRLAYCQRSAGDKEAGDATERRAIESLENELAATTDVEVPFYLANAYQNVGQQEDARRVAADATARFERGDLARPEAGTGMFQLGKLYADQNVTERAEEWYVRAVDALTAKDTPGGSYVRRASRYLAGNAHGRKDYAAAQRYFSLLLEAGEATPADLNRLAESSARVGLYEEAAAAWKQVGLANPAEANAALYGSRLATLAFESKALAAEAPSGKAWGQVSKEELEALMKEQSERVRAIRAEAEQIETIDRPVRQAYRKRMEEIRGIFVPAALEYVFRGFSIRETAFFGGYAPLILNPSAWIPPKKKGPGSE